MLPRAASEAGDASALVWRSAGTGDDGQSPRARPDQPICREASAEQVIGENGINGNPAHWLVHEDHAQAPTHTLFDDLVRWRAG